jgi:hypothetical protein
MTAAAAKKTRLRKRRGIRGLSQIQREAQLPNQAENPGDLHFIPAHPV